RSGNGIEASRRRLCGSNAPVCSFKGGFVLTERRRDSFTRRAIGVLQNRSSSRKARCVVHEQNRVRRLWLDQDHRAIGVAANALETFMQERIAPNAIGLVRHPHGAFVTNARALAVPRRYGVGTYRNQWVDHYSDPRALLLNDVKVSHLGRTRIDIVTL